jgi:hypothetical protein
MRKTIGHAKKYNIAVSKSGFVVDHCKEQHKFQYCNYGFSQLNGYDDIIDEWEISIIDNNQGKLPKYIVDIMVNDLQNKFMMIIFDELKILSTEYNNVIINNKLKADKWIIQENMTGGHNNYYDKYVKYKTKYRSLK